MTLETFQFLQKANARKRAVELEIIKRNNAVLRKLIRSYKSR